MKTSRLFALFFLIPLVVAQAQDADGWRPLFDGKTLEGWELLNGTASYVVEEGAILGTTAEGSPNSFLCSVEDFGNFELEFEVKVDDGLNSGVQIRSRQETDADIKMDAKKQKNEVPRRFRGPQVEIEKSPGQSGWIYGEATGLGWLSEGPQSKDRATNQHSRIKNGEWNNYRVVANGSNIQTWINGNQVANLTHEEVFQSHPKGKLGLQVHSIGKGSGPFQVRWRNIRIKALD